VELKWTKLTKPFISDLSIQLSYYHW